MADAISRSWADPARPARVFAPVFAVAAVAFLIAAVVVGATAVGQKPDLLASTSGPVLTLPEAPARSLVLYAALADGSDPSDDLLCRLQTSGDARAGYARGVGTYEVDGRTLHRTGTVGEGWAPGDTVTCAGVAQLAAVSGSGAGPRLAFAGILLAVGLGSGVMALVGRTSRRNRAP